jgi:hypothetical protein
MSTWYVSTTGNDTTGNGSSGAPFATINRAHTAAANGDIIQIAAGNYTINNRIGSAAAIILSKQVTLQGRTGTDARPVITIEQKQDGVAVDISNSNISINGLTLIHKAYSTSTAEATAGGPGGIDTTINIRPGGSSINPDGGLITIENINISDCRIEFIKFGVSSKGKYFTVNNCILHCRASGTTRGRAVGIYSQDGTISITNNTLTSSSSLRVQMIHQNFATNDGFINKRNGKLIVSGNTCSGLGTTTGAIQEHFVFFEAGTDDGVSGDTYQLEVLNNTIKTGTSQFVVIQPDNPEWLNTFLQKVTITGNTAESLPASWFFIDARYSGITTMTIPTSNRFVINSNTATGTFNTLTTHDTYKNVVSVRKLNDSSVQMAFATHISSNAAAFEAIIDATSPYNPPSAPTITKVTASNAALVIDFTAPTDNGGAPITRYEFSTNAGSSWTSIASTASPLTASGLINGTLYNIIIRAVNIAGGGTASNSMSETPLAFRYVYPGSLPATPQLPSYTTIASAITAATTGDTIKIAAGTFNETVVPPTTKSLIIEGAGIDTTIINGQSNGNGITISGTATTIDLTIKDLTINGTAGNPASVEWASIYMTASRRNVDINGCKIVAQGDYALLTNSFNATSFRVRNCTITGNTYTGSATPVQTWGGSYFTEGVKLVNGVWITDPSGANANNRAQFNVPNIPRQLITLNTGTYTTAQFTNNIIGDGTNSTGAYDASNIIHANTVMTCDAANVTISGNTFNTACYALLSSTMALRVRGNGCTVENNTFKNPIVNGYILDNKQLTGTNGTNTVTYRANIIDMTTASKTSGHSISAASYDPSGVTFGNQTYATIPASYVRKCWVISGFDPVNTISAVAYIGLSKVIEADKSTLLVSPTNNNAESITTIAAAITAAAINDVVQVSNDSYTITSEINLEKQITLKGSGKNSTTLNFSNVNVKVNIRTSGVVLQDLRVVNANSNNQFICHITRPNLTTDTSGITISNVAFQAATRGVALDSVSNVVFTNCDMPQTANYSIGLASVKGCSLSGCTVPASAFGSIGIFPSTAWIAAAAAAGTTIDISTRNIDLTGCTFTGPNGIGAIQVQPVTGTNAISYGFGSENVKLAAAFKYVYMQQTRDSSGANVGDMNATISNIRYFNIPGDVTTTGSGANTYASLQAFAAAQLPGGRVLVYGRDISTTPATLFFDAPFDQEDKTFAGIFTTQTALASSAITDVSNATSASTAVFSQVVVEPEAPTEVKVQTYVNAIELIIEAATVVAPAVVQASLIGLIKAANQAAGAPTPSFEQKTALEQIINGNTSFNVDVSNNVRDDILATIPPAKKAESAAALPMEIFVPQGTYIKLPATPLDKVYYFPAMKNGEAYTLLFDYETSLPVGATGSQMKFENGELYFSTDGNTFNAVALGGNISIVRNGFTFNYPVYIKGSAGVGGGNVPCFPAGQRVMTANGWCAVEELKDGDMLITDRGVAVPAKVHTTLVKTTEKSAPITIGASALGQNVPSVPVRLSPLHAIRTSANTWDFPIRLLANKKGVVQDAPHKSITYYHVELPNYLEDNIIVEGGLVAESYGANYVRVNGLADSKIYTYSKQLDGFTRVSVGAKKAVARKA